MITVHATKTGRVQRLAACTDKFHAVHLVVTPSLPDMLPLYRNIKGSRLAW